MYASARARTGDYVRVHIYVRMCTRRVAPARIEYSFFAYAYVWEIFAIVMLPFFGAYCTN